MGSSVAMQKVVDANQDTLFGVHFLLVPVCGSAISAWREGRVDSVEHAAIASILAK